MAFSSVSSSRPSKNDVFLSFCHPDVGNRLISHLRKKFSDNGITMFYDQPRERSGPIGPSVVEAIRESKISIVVFSINYPYWCLDELVEIMNCKKELNQIVVPVYYYVTSMEVGKQTGEFGKAFKNISVRKNTLEDQRTNWSQALNEVTSSSAGYHFPGRLNEAAMIENIASDISNKLRKRKSRCFTVMAFLVVINLALEIVSVVSEQLSSKRKPYFTRISLVMSILSVVFYIIDLSCKVREQKACFRCKWPIPWFYYSSPGYKRIFGSYTDTVLLFCVVGSLIVSTINYRFVATGQDGPIKTSIWPLFFAIGMVVSKFLEKPISWNTADPKPYHSMV